MSENKITIGIKVPLNRAASQSSSPIKVENYSYFPADEIGLGYISHVYLGRNDHTGEIVAIKVIDFSKEDELGQQLIQDELNILEDIKRHHPNYLLLLYDHFKVKNHLYIVTEYCEGKDIAKILRKKKVLGEGEAQSIMKQLMQAYRELYEMKIIHRDLKLANVLVKQGKLKLADFGFSIKQQKCQQQKSDYNVGSPYYMPPQTLKWNRYSFHSDIWALGVMAYEMVYGKLPWKEKVESMLYEKIVNASLQDLFDPSVVISEHYKAFIKSCLQVQVERRASPQFAIHYTWPLAGDCIQGLQNQPGSRPMSMLQEFGTLTTRQIASHHFIHDSSIRSNQNSFVKHQPLREKSPNFLNRTATQEAKVAFTLNTSIKQIEKSFTQGGKELEMVSKVILSQIHYCRYLHNLWEMIEEDTSIGEKYLAHYVHAVFLAKIKELSKLENGMTCSFSQIPFFKQFCETQRWLKLKQIIREYAITFLANSSYDSPTDSSSCQPLKRAIRQLKPNIQLSFPLLEQLTYLYQLRQLQKRNNLAQFAVNSKIALLANRRREKHADVASYQLCDRIRSRLALLDL